MKLLPKNYEGLIQAKNLWEIRIQNQLSAVREAEQALSRSCAEYNLILRALEAEEK